VVAGANDGFGRLARVLPQWQHDFAGERHPPDGNSGGQLLEVGRMNPVAEA